jgi:hypothetical protein
VIDNVVLMPASVLPYKAHYQQLANRLPRGDVLIVLPSHSMMQFRMVQSVTAFFQRNGHHVTVVPAEAFPTPSVK